MKRSKFCEDYYRLRGGKNFPLLLDILFRHNIRFLLWFRKYTEARTPFGRLLFRFALYRMSRKYGLEFSTNAAIDGGLYLCHPYNITVGNGAVLGKNCCLYNGLYAWCGLSRPRWLTAPWQQRFCGYQCIYNRGGYNRR